MRTETELDHTAEDDQLRSLHMRGLIQGDNTLAPSFGDVTIPKVLLQFWHDLGELPTDVRACLESWKPLTARGFKRLLFDDIEARAFIRDQFGGPYAVAFDRCQHPAMRCDYFRLCYIHKNGGFYVDADEAYQGGDCEFLYRDNQLKVQPLCYDTRTELMVDCDVFMGRRVYSPDWILYVNNNPIIAPPGHPIVRLSLERATRLLLASAGECFDIQSTTGPGNFTASLVQHSLALAAASLRPDFHILRHWDVISACRWPLSYRVDQRNWRLWKPVF